MIASLSGIRGVLNADLTLDDIARFVGNFAGASGADEILIARDTRRTGPVISRTVVAALMSKGVDVYDLGVVSTPALFRTSRVLERPAIMVTASHNEPEFNGLKFIVGGRGIAQEMFEEVVGAKRDGPPRAASGVLRPAPPPSYVDDLAKMFGDKRCKGARVALDLCGGAAIVHAPTLLRRLGCEVYSINDVPGIFSRRVDPSVDELASLKDLVVKKGCDIGLGFDCDGDRLVIVDSGGRKRSGDYMLTFAVTELLRETENSNVVVSMDTTQAVDDVVREAGGHVFRSKVGEANVVRRMVESGARIGGEGSSGGLIDGAFNDCRDSMLAALVIVRALRDRGRRSYEEVPSYSQERVVVRVPKAKAQRSFRRFVQKYADADTTDGVKVFLGKRSWVLMRVSGTEDIVRVSAEAETAREAQRNAKAFAAKLVELSG